MIDWELFAVGWALLQESRSAMRLAGKSTNRRIVNGEAIFSGKLTGFAQGVARAFLVHRESHGGQFFQSRPALNRCQPVAALRDQKDIRHFQIPQGGHDHRGAGGNIIQPLIRFRGGLALINPRETHGRIHDETGAQRRPSPIHDLTSAVVSLDFPWLW